MVVLYMSSLNACFRGTSSLTRQPEPPINLVSGKGHVPQLE